MAKDYFQDITPPEPGSAPPRQPALPPDIPTRYSNDAETPERSIRSIQASPTRSRGGFGGGDVRETMAKPPKRNASRVWMWAAVVVALLILGAIALVALRPTSVVVVPRTHEVIFDDSAIFTAYPAASAATGTLTFTIQSETIEESEIVSAQGVESVEERSSGTITIYNDYSTESVRLIENTRFESPGGLIFKIRDAVVVPGKRGTTPGQLTVTVYADEPGEKYNIELVDKFMVPGLRSTPAMYSGMYARSTSAMSGGFVGDRPAAAQSELDAAQANARARVEAKVQEMAAAHTNENSFAFAELARITYERVAATPEEEGVVRVHERARIELPVFAADEFAHLIAESVSADADKGAVLLRPRSGFAVERVVAPADELGAALRFNLQGMATVVWKVNVEELQDALAGREEGAFQTVVGSFEGIAKAHARVEPFWKNTFPVDPQDIKVKLQQLE